MFIKLYLIALPVFFAIDMVWSYRRSQYEARSIFWDTGIY